MDISGILGLIASLSLSFVFFPKKSYLLILEKQSYWYGSLAFSMILTIGYYCRLNFEFVDIHCPTNILGFVSQLRRGHFPVSFLAFPSFPANYHAGFPTIAGYLSRWFGLNEFVALRFLSVSIFFIVAFGVQLFFLMLHSGWRFLLGTLLLFFSFSFPVAQFFPQISLPTWVKDTSVFDYFRSNSWPLTYLTLLSMLFYFWKKPFSFQAMMVFALYSLLLAFLNATVFSLVILATITTVGYEIFFIPASRKIWLKNSCKYLIIFLVVLFLIRKITQELPSAFMMGPDYRQVNVGLRFLLKGYLLEMQAYFIQCGLLPWIVLPVALSLLISRKDIAFIRGIAILFILGFSFPMIFCLVNITSWDNYHKFFLTAYFAGSILYVITWLKTRGLRKKLMTIGLVLVLLTSSPNAWLMMRNQTVLLPVPAYDATNNDIISFLKQQPNNTHLLPFAKEGYVFCSPYTEVAAASGIFTDDGYCFWFFTLAAKDEADFIYRQDWWKTKSAFEEEFKRIAHQRYFIIIQKKYIDDFHQMVERWGHKDLITRQFTFKNFFLIKVDK